MNIIRLENGKLASASSDKTIKIWDTEKGVCERTILGHSGYVSALVEIPSRKMLISGGENEIRFWDVRDLVGCKSKEVMCTRMLSIEGESCLCIVLLDEEQMACGVGENIKIFRVEGPSLQVKALVGGHTSCVTDLLLMRENQCLLSGSIDKTIVVWDVLRGSRVRRLQGTSVINRVMLFRENVVAVSYSNGSIRFWKVDTGECVKVLSTKQESLWEIARDLRGRFVSCGSDGTVKFWGY